MFAVDEGWEIQASVVQIAALLLCVLKCHSRRHNTLVLVGGSEARLVGEST